MTGSVAVGGGEGEIRGHKDLGVPLHGRRGGRLLLRWCVECRKGTVACSDVGGLSSKLAGNRDIEEKPEVVQQPLLNVGELSFPETH
jgi:hypothetical protein